MNCNDCEGISLYTDFNGLGRILTDLQIILKRRDNTGIYRIEVETIAPIQECECKDAIASLIRKTNAILAALRAVGIIAEE